MTMARSTLLAPACAAGKAWTQLGLLRGMDKSRSFLDICTEWSQSLWHLRLWKEELGRRAPSVMDLDRCGTEGEEGNED